MLWSLAKIVFFIAAVAGLAAGAAYLAESGEGIRVAIGTMEFNLGPLQAVIVALVLLIGIWLAFKILGFAVAIVRFINGDETAVSRYFDRNRERRGFEALAEGLVALATGEGRVAMSKAAKAERYLQRPELTNLITAQAAEMIGDRKKAEEVYKRLLADDKTRFVGIHGLMRQKLLEGDTDTAMKLAERAFALKPKHAETGDTLLKLQAEHKNWQGARQTIGTKLRHGQLPRDVHRRRDAVLAISEARDLLANDERDRAYKLAIESNKLSPELTPAAVLAAEALLHGGKKRAAAKALVSAWRLSPHPDIARAFAAIEPDESPEQRLKRFQQLVKANPDHKETKLLLAELHIAAGDFESARQALGDLAEQEPTARSLAILAAILKGEGADERIVRETLTKAVSAPRGEQWVCANCQTVHAEWSPVCSNCGAVDSLEWRLPAENEAVSLAGPADFVPLLVGDAPSESPQEPDSTDVISEATSPIVDAAQAPEDWEREI